MANFAKLIKIYDHEGELAEEYYEINGKKEGIYKDYQFGFVSCINYVNGLRYGEYKCYNNINGNINRKNVYYNDKFVDKENEYNEDGDLVKSTNYINDKFLDQTSYYYYKNRGLYVTSKFNFIDEKHRLSSKK